MSAFVLRAAAAASLVALVLGAEARGGFVDYYGSKPGYPTEKDWYSDVGGAFTTLDFVLPPWEFLTDQYAHLGVTFPEGHEFVDYGNYEDFYGASAGNPIGAFMEVAFDTPHRAFMVKFPGLAMFELYSGEELLFTTLPENGPGTTPGYIGVIGDIGFDRVRIISPGGALFVDDIYFAMPIPGPGVLGVMAFGALACPRRRRRRMCKQVTNSVGGAE